MISPGVQHSLRNAKSYFREHLAIGDYYAEDATITGQWFGRAAERLGLAGPVQEAPFLALCDGRHPHTGERLTARLNSTRANGNTHQSNRRIFYDFVFRPPKSVSILAYLADERIIPLHRQAVLTSLVALERYAETRIRLDGECSDRRTANIVAALFEHDTSREQDPLLHTHAVIFNATWDPEERRWKALQTREMFKALAYATAVYNTELTREIARLGYAIHAAAKSWEIAGVPRDVVETFSKRRDHITQRLAEELARPENAHVDPHQLRDRIAREERKRKIRPADRRSLLQKWRAELGAERAAGLTQLRLRASAAPRPLARPDYVGATQWAKSLVFERKSVVRRHELLAAAARRLLGTDATVAELDRVVAGAGIVTEDSGDRITSREGLRQEWSLVQRAEASRGRYPPFALLPAAHADEQQQAIATVLGSRDGVTLFRGRAGTGKTTTLRRMVDALASAGHPVRVATPQAQQARQLTADGLPAQTLTHLLGDATLPLGATIVVDEAGQVGGRTLTALFDFARGRGARLILSGDTRQHPAVEASDALRSLESFAHLTTAEIKHVRRQDPALGATAHERRQIETYRRAVVAAGEGRAASALALLSAADFVHLTEDIVPATAAEFLRLSEAGAEVLAVSQTRESVAALNAAITQALHAAGRIPRLQKLATYVPRDLLAAEKILPETYRPGDFLRLVRNYGALPRDQILVVEAVAADRLTLRAGVRAHRAALRYADHWELLDRQEIDVGPGSVLQLKANGFTLDGQRRCNGERVTVEAIGDAGILTVRGPDDQLRRLGPHQLVLQHGYAVTSYGAQGRTVDAVLLADAGVSAATHQKEWYVSISRARRQIAVFTPDLRDLAHRISADGNRLLGLELIPDYPVRRRAVRPAIPAPAAGFQP